MVIGDRRRKNLKVFKDMKRQIAKEETQMVKKHLKNVQPAGDHNHANKGNSGADLSALIK